MTVVLVGLFLLLLAAVAALASIAIRSQLAPAPSLCSKTIVVHTRDEQSIRGVFFAQHADRVTLQEVTYLHGEDKQPVEGLVHVPVDSISWMQEILPSSA